MAGKLVGWFKTENNREAVLALLTVATALLGGGWFLYDRLFPGRSDGGGGASQHVEVGGNTGSVQQVAEGGVAVMAGTGAVVTISSTSEQYEERLARRAAELGAELATAHAGEKAGLVAQLNEVRRQLADVEASWAVRKAELGRAMARLDAVAAGLPQAKLDAALAALDKGETGKADELFAQVQAMEAAGSRARRRRPSSGASWRRARCAGRTRPGITARRHGWRRATAPPRGAGDGMALRRLSGGAALG